MISNNHNSKHQSTDTQANIYERDGDARIQTVILDAAIGEGQASRIAGRLTVEEQTDTPRQTDTRQSEADAGDRLEQFMRVYAPLSNINRAPYDDRHELDDIEVIEYESRHRHDSDINRGLANKQRPERIKESEGIEKPISNEKTQEKTNFRDKHNSTHKIHNDEYLYDKSEQYSNSHVEHKNQYEAQVDLSNKLEKELEQRLIKQDRQLNDNIIDYSTKQARRDHINEIQQSGNLSSYHHATDTHTDTMIDKLDIVDILDIHHVSDMDKICQMRDQLSDGRY